MSLTDAHDVSEDAMFWKTGLASLFIFAAVLVLLPGCRCGDDDDDDDFDGPYGDDDATGDDDTSDDDVDDDSDDDADDDWIEPTAWDDFQEAERQVELANFSTALVYYADCIEKLTDDEPRNDGPAPELTLKRAEYGWTLMLTTLPLRIIESFLSGWLDAGQLAAMMEESLRDIDAYPEDQPTSLISVYLYEIILPLLDLGCKRLDHARAAEDFVYRMPPMRFVLMNTAIEIPAVGDEDGRGEHDRTDAHLMATFYHLIHSSALAVTSQNLDTDAGRIDDILAILMNGDFADIMGLLEDFPSLLTLHDDAEIDGAAILDQAHRQWMTSLAALFDDNDADGLYSVDNNGTPGNPFDDFPDPGELPDDFGDSLRAESDDQEDDIIRQGAFGISLNIRANGSEVGAGGVIGLLNLALGLVSDDLLRDVESCLMGLFPPEENADNRMDDEMGTGVSTGLTADTLSDASSSYAPDALVGYVLNPNVNQPAQSEANITFPIIANTSTTIYVVGDMTSSAQVGDTYSVGDGWIDDKPFDISALLHALMGNFVTPNCQTGFYLSEPYDVPFGIRDILPAWDEADGNPDFFLFVVDRTETYTDENSNGQYDPGIDPFVDADHVWGDFNFPADGVFQPTYFYFPDGRLGGLLQYGGDWAGHDPTDNLNRIVSGIFTLVEGGLR
jgi:hypothetical protein